MALIHFWTWLFDKMGIALPYGWAWLLSQAVFIVLLCLVLMLSVAVVILADRKIWAAVQMRRGPNVVGPFGLLQTIADALKFFFKEVIIPSGSNKVLFLLAPVVSVVLAFIAWAVIPFNAGWVLSDINVGILYLFAVSSLSVYGVIMAGWASNSKYAFLSALRGAAQMVSYEVSIGFVMITVLLFAGSLNLSRHRARPRRMLASRTGTLHHAVPDADHLLRLLPGGDPAPAFRPAGSGVRTGGGILRGIFLGAVPALLPGRIYERHHALQPDEHPVPGRLAAAAQYRAIHPGAGHHLVRA